jgi:hypothetical protein
VWPGPNILEAATQARYPRHCWCCSGRRLTGRRSICAATPDERQRHRHHRSDYALRRSTAGVGARSAARCCRSWSSAWVRRSGAKARRNKPVRSSPMCCRTASNSPMSNADLLVACGAGAGMAAAYGVPSAAHCSRSKCCAACWRFGSFCRRCSPRRSRPRCRGRCCRTRRPTRFRPIPCPHRWSAGHWRPGRSSAGYRSDTFVSWRGRTPTSRRAGAGSYFRASRCCCSARYRSPFPQLLGNGKELAQLAFADQVAPLLMVALLVLRPLGHDRLPRQRRTGRLVHAVVGTRGIARRSSRYRLVLGLARGSAGALCCSGCGCSVGRNDPRPHLLGRIDHGTDRTRPILHVAATDRGRGCNRGRTHARPALDLRCAFDRPGDQKAATRSTAGADLVRTPA